MRQVLRKFEGEGRFGLLALAMTLAAIGCGGGGGGGGGGGTYSPITSGNVTSGSLPGTPANLVAIDLFPKGDISIFGSASSTAAAPPQQQIIVVGYYKDGASRDLTRTVKYVVADAKIAAISGDGLVTPAGGGITTLTVSVQGQNNSTLTITRNINVNLTKIAGQAGVLATALELYPGPVDRLTDVNPTTGTVQMQQFVTIVRYADGTCIDLSRNLGLTIQDSTTQSPSVAAKFSTGGLLQGVSNGTVDVIADLSVVNMVASSRVVLGDGGAGGGSGNGITPFTGGALAGSTNPFDVVVLSALKAQKINPAALSSDNEFIRRVTSDLAGRLPTTAELNAFIADKTATKRATLIDTLLASPEFAMHWANDILGAWTCVGGTAETAFNAELQKEIAADTPVTTMVNAMAAGTGPLGAGFDATFAMPYMKSDQLINEFTGFTSKCARCHDHPLTTVADNPQWIQDQNYALYAFFAVTPADATKVNKAAQMFGTPLEPAWVFDPTVNATLPKLTDPLATRRQKFADLFVQTSVFARGTGHRIWAEVMAPLLDSNLFLQSNLAGVGNPALLTQIAQTFTDQKGSLKGFLRTITNSKTYQLTTAGKTTTGDALQARRTVRRQHSEVLEQGLYAMAGIAYKSDAFFAFNFGYPTTRLLINERNDEVNMSQAFTEMNSTHSTNGLVAMNGNTIMTLATSVDANTTTLPAAITQIFNSLLSRDPTPAELNTFTTERAGVGTGAGTTLIFLQDAAVAVGSSIEFVMR